MLQVLDLTSPVSGALKAIPSCLEVVERLVELLPVSQNERSVVSNGLVERLAGQKEHADVVRVRRDLHKLVFVVVLLERDSVSRFKDGVVVLDTDGALEEHKHRVPPLGDHMLVHLAGFVEGEVNVVGGSTGYDGSLDIEDFPGDDLC